MGEFDAFLNWERTSRDTIDVKKIYIDMVDDLIAGVMLSQIVYWYLPSKEGNTKISVIKHGKEWIAKSRHEWWEECRISPKQVDRALRLLTKKGIIETKLYKFNNTPTKHIRIVKEQFLTLWQNLISTKRENPFLPKGQNPFYPKGEIQDLPQMAKSITENTETTSETTTKAGDEIDIMKEAVKKYLKLYGSRQDNIAKLLLNKHTGAKREYNIGGEPATPDDLRQFCEAWRKQKTGLNLPQTMDSVCNWFNRWRDAQHKKITEADSSKMLNLPDPSHPDYDRIMESELKRVNGIPA